MKDPISDQCLYHIEKWFYAKLYLCELYNDKIKDGDNKSSSLISLRQLQLVGSSSE